MRIKKTVEYIGSPLPAEVDYQDQPGTFLDFANIYMNISPWDRCLVSCDVCEDFLIRRSSGMAITYEPCMEEKE